MATPKAKEGRKRKGNNLKQRSSSSLGLDIGKFKRVVSPVGIHTSLFGRILHLYILLMFLFLYLFSFFLQEKREQNLEVEKSMRLKQLLILHPILQLRQQLLMAPDND
jgi:hypothetical protein